MNTETNMGNNLIDVSFWYSKGQGHGGNICVNLSIKKVTEKECMHIF
jgi:hypothetical protein